MSTEQPAGQQALQHEPLTSREREVLALAEQGLSNKDIARALGITRNAVRFHLKELHSKLETGSERERLRSWRRTWKLGALPFGFGSLTSGVATGAIVAGIAIGGFAAYRAHPDAQAKGPAPRVVDGFYQNHCPTSLTTYGGQSMDYFGNMYRLTAHQIRQLNPSLPDGPLADGIEVNVPFIESMTCGSATMTPPGSTAAAHGTPQAPVDIIVTVTPARE